jgi:AhpD family alkylhydroperoxidase
MEQKVLSVFKPKTKNSLKSCGILLVIKYIQAVYPKSAEGLVASVYSQIKRDFGRIVEPFLLHSPLPELLAGVWIACRETELVGNVSRSIKEAVAVAVSIQNQCPYCIDAHSIMLNADGEKALAQAIVKAELDKIKDSQTRGIVDWALKGSAVDFTRVEAAEIVGTAVYFHYMNRMASVLLGETPLPSNQRLLKGGFSRVASIMFSSAVHRPKTVGDSLDFLPEAELPQDLSWATPVRNVAGAFARFAKVIEIDGEYALPAEVRLRVEREIGSLVVRKNEFNPIRTAEITGEFSDEAWKSTAQLALMAAFLPYRIDEKVIGAFRSHYPEDTKLLGALAWASFTAARKIGAQLVKR